MGFLAIINDFLDWSIPTFKNATAHSSLRKLEHEIEEVKGEDDKIELCSEYADCVMCTFDSAKRAGINPEEIIEEIRVKVLINRSRKWKENKDGTYSHIK